MRRLVCRLLGHHWSTWFTPGFRALYPQGGNVRVCFRCSKREWDGVAP